MTTVFVLIVAQTGGVRGRSGHLKSHRGPKKSWVGTIGEPCRSSGRLAEAAGDKRLIVMSAASWR